MTNNKVNNSPEAKKRKIKRMILFGAGGVATAVLGFLGWKWMLHMNQKPNGDFYDPEFKLPQQNAVFPAVKRNDDFPLKKGSKGLRVKALQEALIRKHGSSILPRFGADGDFGSEMEAALKKLSLPEQISESTFNVLAVGESSSLDAKAIAASLYQAATSKNLSQALASLGKMKTTSDYSSVGEEFKKSKLRGVSQTLVNGLLGSFSDEKSKQQIRLEFTRMGLKYDGTKWSLGGLDGIPHGQKIITAEPTVIYTAKGKGRMHIPKDIILGKKEYVIAGWAFFYPHKSDTLFKVRQEHITIYKPTKNEKSKKH